MRSMRQNVFPEPGPATTSRGRGSASIAARWEGVGAWRTEHAQLKTQKPSAAGQIEKEQITGKGDVYVRRFLIGGQWWLDVWVRTPAGWRVTAVQGTVAKK